LWQEGKISPEDLVFKYIPHFSGENSKIKIENLLLHDSGLPAYREYFRCLGNISKDERESKRICLISEEPLQFIPGKGVCYSDLGFMVLKNILEKVADAKMSEYLEKNFYSKIEAHNILFPVNKKLDEDLFMVTSFSDFRNRYLKGEVDDDNAFIMGGIDGHAGLFGNCASVHNVLKEIYNSFSENKSGILKQDFVVKLLNKKSYNRVCGFDTPDYPVSSAGSFFSQNTIGHLGFTGTSFWMDLIKGSWIILLTNRVYYKNSISSIKLFRPTIHDLLFKDCLFCSCK